MTFTDCNLSFGHWPFARLPKRSLPQLVAHLEQHKIKHGLVSYLETLFVPDPDPANRELLQSCKRLPSLTPVPVLNLSLPNWRESLETYRAKTELKAVKLYPNFHNYSLRSKNCARLTEYLADTNIRLIINVRMLDERHQYHGLKIKGVSVKQLIAYAQRFPDFKFLCTGLFRPEILELADSCPNLCTDLSFADWHDLVHGLLEVMSPDRLFFGSHTPLMVTEANTYKLQASNITTALKTQIASGNAKRFFRL
ncbi:amidohydrolase family protein [Pelagicoccus sp. SDUM812002]|uniref:amidohydrolase family protein n=1 Tax=Pelagicoccus sp. SDUM812002 TaxID=3041266 RepID=UPI00280F065E|nr:amidohydrolase family protein [Pelagicoccus sp. SDUM812002]MDQ8187701.1 amidohydrolase family protein [Pelagicoccus sp. SDUM812002]